MILLSLNPYSNVVMYGRPTYKPLVLSSDAYQMAGNITINDMNNDKNVYGEYKQIIILYYLK